MAGGMIRELAVIVCAQINNSQSVDQKFCKFKNTLTEAFDARKPLGILCEQFLVLMFEHMCTGSGWDDDIACGFFKYTEGMFRDPTRIGSQAGIIRGLTTTGLTAGKLHKQAEAVQDIYDGLTCAWVKRIDQA